MWSPIRHCRLLSFSNNENFDLQSSPLKVRELQLGDLHCPVFQNGKVHLFPACEFDENGGRMLVVFRNRGMDDVLHRKQVLELQASSVTRQASSRHPSDQLQHTTQSS
jgi:hypothetical protein